MESHAVLVTIAISLAGFIATFIVSYFKFTNEFNFIKGQITQLLKIHEGYVDLVENHAKLEADVNKVFKDVDKAYLRIKILENAISGGKH